MMNNKLLGRWQKKNLSDEFYTRREDIEAMLPEWDLSDKVVYCCADSEESEFVKYFKQSNKCKELIYTSDDFRTHEDLFERCDIVVTNPPFSLIRVLLRTLAKYKKDFILIQTVLPARAIPSPWEKKLYDDYFYFKRVERFSNTDKKVNCNWGSNIGTEKHPIGYSFRELYGRDIPICQEPEKQPIVGRYGDNIPIRKFGKKSGFPPRDFDGVFALTAGNCCSEFRVVSVKDLPNFKWDYSHVKDVFVRWRDRKTT